MTTLEEFKAVEVWAKATHNLGGSACLTCEAKIELKGLSFLAFPALLAVAEQMADALNQATSFIGWLPPDSKKILAPMEEALAAFENWKKEIEGHDR